MTLNMFFFHPQRHQSVLIQIKDKNESVDSPVVTCHIVELDLVAELAVEGHRVEGGADWEGAAIEER